MIWFWHIPLLNYLAVMFGFGLLWSAMQIFVNASTPMNAAFRAKETRNWFRLRLTALGLLLGLALGFLAHVTDVVVDFLNPERLDPRHGGLLGD